MNRKYVQWDMFVAGAEAPDERSGRAGEARRIVLADDDESFARPLCSLLRRHGYEVISASDVNHAREEIARGDVDLLLTDIYMPGNRSMELLAYVNRERPHLPCIVMTGRPEAASAIQALRMGAGDYLPKPFEFDDLHARIQQLISRAERLRVAMRALETLSSLLPELELRRQNSTRARVDALTVTRAPAAVAAASADQRRWDTLSEREREVVDTFARTPTVAAVARALEISVHTVRNHFRAIYRKLDVRSQVELISFIRDRETRLGTASSACRPTR